MSLQTLLSKGCSSFALVERLEVRDPSATHALACFAQDDISFENITFQFFKELSPGSLTIDFWFLAAGPAADNHQKSEDSFSSTTRLSNHIRLSLCHKSSDFRGLQGQFT